MLTVLGIMKMFGGFGSAFFKEYHDIVPKTEPTAEYEDRIQLYMLWVLSAACCVKLLTCIGTIN